MRRVFLYRLFLLIFLPIGAWAMGLQALSYAQQPRYLPQTPERLIAHFDKAFYVAGEDLWYAIHFLEPANQVSGILHVELIDPQGNFVFRQSLKAESSLVPGDMPLPASLKTGYYLFRAYTYWNLNFEPQEIYEQAIAVYSPNVGVSAPPTDLPKAVPVAQQAPLSLRAKQASFAPREWVELELGGEGATSLSQYSLSVMASAYVGPQRDPFVSVGDSEAPRFVRAEAPIEPETRYERTALIKEPVEGEAISSNFIVAFVRNTRQKILTNAQEGEVSLVFDDFYDSSMVQLFDASPFKSAYVPEVTLLEETYPISLGEPITERPPLTDAVKAYVWDYRRRFQLNQVFGSADYLRASRQEQTTPPVKPTLVYRTEDFIVMPDMDAFVQQAVPPLTIKPRKKKRLSTPAVAGLPAYGKKFDLFIPHKDFENKDIVKSRPPLMMVNNYFTYDTRAIFEAVKWADVSVLEIFNANLDLPFQFGPIGNFGVIHFRTRDGVTPPEILRARNNLVVPGFYLPRIFMTSAMSEEAEGSRIPNFQPMVYWGTGTETEEGTIRFPAGDKPGTYLVRLTGLTKDGRPVYLETNFTVLVKR